MTKESGLGLSFSVDDSTPTLQDISNDVTNVSFATLRASQDVTGVDKSAMERLGLRSDFNCAPNGVFNDASGKSHAVYKNAHTGTTARTVTIAISGQTLSNETLVESFTYTEGTDGSLTWAASHQLADGTVPAWS